MPVFSPFPPVRVRDDQSELVVGMNQDLIFLHRKPPNYIYEN